jgi:hypothetical protein
MTCLSLVWRLAFHEALDAQMIKFKKVICQGDAVSAGAVRHWVGASGVPFVPVR